MNVTPKACANCRYWSDQIAVVTEGGMTAAMCLNHYAYRFEQHTVSVHVCSDYANAYMGAIDEPGADPLRYLSADQRFAIESDGGEI